MDGEDAEIELLDDYDAMNAFWDAASRSVDTMRVVLAKFARVLKLEGNPGPLLEGDGDPHVLVIVCIDSDTITAATMVPMARLDQRLTNALETIDGRTFAGGADLSTEQWDAAVLVISALALEMRDAAELARWAHDEGSSLSEEDVATYWSAWAGHDVRTWNDLARDTTAVYTLRRAM